MRIISGRQPYNACHLDGDYRYRTGSSISLALALIGLRSENAQQAAALSGMSQSFGYLLAAVGPIFVGYLFDQTHSWTMPIVLLIAALIVMGAAGLGAGRDRYILQSAKQRNSA